MKELRQLLLNKLKFAKDLCYLVTPDLLPSSTRVFFIASFFVLSACVQLQYEQDPLSMTSLVKKFPDYIFHSFQASDKIESPNIDILDFQYGDIRPDPSHYESLGVLSKDWINSVPNIAGVIKKGDFFYIKWKDVISGEVFERKVDLKSGLSMDIYLHTISYSIRKNKLSVYLITPKNKPSGLMQNVPNKYADKVVVTLYSE